jgi:hypothetical protein
VTSLFFDIFGRDNGATQTFQNVGTAADNAGTRLAALNTQWKAAAQAEQEATTAMETAAQRETTARSAAEAATTRLRDAETQLQQTRTAVASSAENVAAAEQRVSAARRDAVAAEQELATAEQDALSAAERLTTAHNNSSNAARQHSTALKEVENSTRSLGTETDNLISKFRNANLGSTMFAAIGASIQPLLASIGQLSGALGLVPAAATAVGTAFGAAVIGVQGMGTALKDATAAHAAAQKAAQADATAQQAVGAANTAAASAGQQNIAVLKQRVAEGAAHVAQLKAEQAAGQNVTAELKTAQAAQAGLTAELKTAQAAATGNVGALNSYQSAQKNATSAVSAADAAHRQAKAAADAYAASLKNLAPSAQQVVSAIIQLKPVFDDLRLDVQQHLFQGIGDQLLNMGQTDLPVVQTGLTQMAGALNSAMTQVAGFAQQRSSIEAYKQIFSDNAAAANILTGAIKPILQIFTDVASVGAPLLIQLAQHFKDAADRAAEFVSKAKESGQLKQWIQDGIQAVHDLWDAFKNVVAIIKDLATAQGFGPNFLQALRDVTGFIRWVIENIPGATAAVQLFFDAWLIAKVVQGLTGMITTIKSAATAVGLLTTAETANATAATAAGTANVAAAGAASTAWKAAGVLIGAYFAGEFLKQAGAPLDPNQDFGTASFKQKWKDAADTAGKVLTLDFGGVLEKLKGDIARLPAEVNQAQNSTGAAIMNATGTQLKAVGAQIQQEFRNAFTPLPAIVTGAMGGLNVVVNEGIHNIAAAVGQLSPQVQAQLGQLAPAMRAPTQAALAGLLPIVTSGIQNITNQVQGLSPKVQAALAPLSPAMQQAVNSAMGGLLPVVNTGIANITAAVGKAPPQAGAALSPLQAALQTPTNSAFANMLQVVNQGVQNITATTGKMPGQVQTSVGPMSNTLQPAGQSAMQGFYNSMINFYNNTIVPWLQGIANQIASLKGPPSKDYYILHDAGTAIMAGLHDSMQSRWGRIADWLGGLGGQIQGVVSTGGMLDWIQRLFGHAGGGGAGTPPPVPPPAPPSGFDIGGTPSQYDPMKPYKITPAYDFAALNKYLYPTSSGDGGHHGHHGDRDMDWQAMIPHLQTAFSQALQDVFSAGIRTDVDYDALTLRINQVQRLNSRR